MGFRLSVVCIFVGLEEFYCLLGVDDDLAALLHAGGLQEGVLVALGGEVGAAEEGLDAFEAVDVTAGAPGCGLGRFGFGCDAELPEEFFDVADGEGGKGCCVFDNHFLDD